MFSSLVQDIMRAGVLPCTALIHECNAGNIVSIQKVIVCLTG